MYTPSQEILEKYANILINFALGGGGGVKTGEVVFLQVPESAKPLLLVLRSAVLKAGANPITEYLPDEYSKDYFEQADNRQLRFFPSKYLRGKVDEMDHFVRILCETNKYELRNIDPKRIMLRNFSQKPFRDWQREKENVGKMTWTLAMYATETMAKDVNLSLEQYWSQIIKGCYLDYSDPVEKWKETFENIRKIKQKLNDLDIRYLRIEAEDTDLTIGIDKNRKWLGGDGRNIPSFEIFISPDYRETDGFISFNQPLYIYGDIINGIKLHFNDGEVVKASAAEGQQLLLEMIKTKGANKLGEFSLTDNRFSRINMFMGETLFDENLGGKYGNTHIALGAAYRDSLPQNPKKITERMWNEMGYNDSAVHTDIISTTDRTITATMADGQRAVIYKNGRFTL